MTEEVTYCSVTFMFDKVRRGRREGRGEGTKEEVPSEREKGRGEEGRGGRERKKLRLQLSRLSLMCEGYLYSV